VKLLIDTHALIWWDENPLRLGSKARAACLDSGNELWLSVASVWEIQIKMMLGRLALRKPLKLLIDDQVKQNGILILPVKFDHVLRLESLPDRHKDPFDRLLVAQALEENCVLVSHDPMIAQYPVTTVW
jgi:PIN domain nuclease of toxin-antitoxin system